MVSRWEKKQKLKDGADKLTNKMSTPIRTIIYAAKQQKKTSLKICYEKEIIEKPAPLTQVLI